MPLLFDVVLGMHSKHTLLARIRSNKEVVQVKKNDATLLFMLNLVTIAVGLWAIYGGLTCP